ncbi:hypothetical protein SEA_TYPHA_14 [Mycobacterium phage Typha]|uniref:Head-to-tail connector protein n=1 Tax=Mycobacterium phage Typha TaxID=2517971 RepID=A0A482JCH2_9CAUD|nr:hypothetical protein KCH40_gp014 [Mycobacterium phage Typha]QBP29671.1 hypothetical protein SEA_TYPHA_14 [Mycobacterium phage Typha]URM86458.1 hypothetical protein PBI_HILLTOPFARM_14 [Mycobacterium phage Hilltopfarm]
MAIKPKKRNANADHIAALKAKRDLYARAGKDTTSLDAQLARFNAKPAAPVATPVVNTPAPEAKDGSDSGSAPATPPAATPEPPGGDQVENKALDRDDEENAKAKAQQENKALPQSRPAGPSHKPGQRNHPGRKG